MPQDQNAPIAINSLNRRPSVNLSRRFTCVLAKIGLNITKGKDKEKQCFSYPSFSKCKH